MPAKRSFVWKSNIWRQTVEKTSVMFVLSFWQRFERIWTSPWNKTEKVLRSMKYSKNVMNKLFHEICWLPFRMATISSVCFVNSPSDENCSIFTYGHLFCSASSSPVNLVYCSGLLCLDKPRHFDKVYWFRMARTVRIDYLSLSANWLALSFPWLQLLYRGCSSSYWSRFISGRDLNKLYRWPESIVSQYNTHLYIYRLSDHHFTGRRRGSFTPKAAVSVLQHGQHQQPIGRWCSSSSLFTVWLLTAADKLICPVDASTDTAAAAAAAASTWFDLVCAPTSICPYQSVLGGRSYSFNTSRSA